MVGPARSPPKTPAITSDWITLRRVADDFARAVREQQGTAKIP
jgi:hypothetical protein